MPVLNITEFGNVVVDNGCVIPAPIIPPNASQGLAFTATSAQSAVFSNATALVRLLSDVDCYVAFGANPTAVTASSMKIAGNQDTWVAVKSSGLRLAVVA